MGSKYKIKINEPAPSEVEINKHKNFKRVLTKYRKQRKTTRLHSLVNKMNKFIPLLIIILLVLILLFFGKVWLAVGK